LEGKILFVQASLINLCPIKKIKTAKNIEKNYKHKGYS